MNDDDYYLSDQREPDDSIFTLDGESIPIHLHHSLGSGGRNAMAKKIEDAGGDPYATEDEARVIICRYNTPIFKQLEFEYDHDRYKWIEPPSWVDTCLMTGKCEHYLPDKADMTSRRVNRTSRIPFSSEDDEYLVNFLAHRIPFKDSGGRNGNGVYKDLCSDQRASRYPWAARHTWQSWRERYTKNQDIFDPRIDYAVKNQRDPPTKSGEKGQYAIPRRTRRPRPLRHNVQEEEEEEEEDEGLFEMPTIKQQRRESHSQHDRHSMRRQQPLSSQQKRPRIQPSSSDPVTSAGLGQDKRRGKGRRVPTESTHNRPEGNIGSEEALVPVMNDDNNGPGPSQLNEESVVAEPAPSLSAPPVVIQSAPATVVSSQDSRQIPPPPDSQKTLAVLTQRPREDDTVPPDTQATVVPSSPRAQPGRTRRAARRVVSRQPTSQLPVVYNTRSRRVPKEELVQLNMSPETNKRRYGRRGRPRTTMPPDSLSEPQLLSFRESEDQNAPPSVAVIAGEEVQVEEILQVPEKSRQESQERDQDGQGSNDESMSSEDDYATRMLRNANKEMLNQAAQLQSGPSRDFGMVPNTHQLPYVDMTHVAAQAPRSGRKRFIFQPSSDDVNIGMDMDATPKVSQMIKAAKKTAARNPSVLPSSSEPESMETGSTTDSSFPVESTIAHDYKAARSPFTPAHGTMAEEHTRDERHQSRGRSVR